jgi:O-antigen ligase
MKKLHQALFSLLLILLPIQLGRHFWPDFSLISGIRVDYLSPTIYLTDLLVIGILGAWFWERRSQFSVFSFQSSVKKYWWIIAVFCFLLVNALLAQNQGAAFYKLIKLIEFALLGFYVAKSFLDFSLLTSFLSLGIIYSSLIAIAQFLKQASLDGVFWWLGERTFNAFTPGIARAVWDGQLIMRPYATFSHPNVLAGFVLVSLILVLANFSSRPKRRINFAITKSSVIAKFISRFKWITVIFGTLAILASFSRSAWIVGVLVSFWLVIRHLRVTRPDKRIFYFVVCCLLFVLGAFFYSAFHLSMEEAISQRIQLSQAATIMIRENPITGVGLNNFIVRLSEFWFTEAVRFLQPAHNIFLLVAAETGLVGLLIFLWFLILTCKKLLITNNQLLITALSAILALGLFDHYWLTLQQTQLLFAIILGLSWAGKENRIKP